MNQDDTTPAAALLSQVAETHTAQKTASAVQEQAIRDAAAGGHPLTDVARALGNSGRRRIYAVLEKTPEPAPAPELTPVVFLRGAGAPSETWQQVQAAMNARGLVTVRDRTQAWHLARGGVPMILLDFSAGAGTVTRVRARWRVTEVTRPLEELLDRTERDRLGAQPWMQTPVTVEDKNTELPAADADRVTRFDTTAIDPEWLARTVIDHLHTTRSGKHTEK